jgi:hypothetical protein
MLCFVLFLKLFMISKFREYTNTRLDRCNCPHTVHSFHEKKHERHGYQSDGVNVTIIEIRNKEIIIFVQTRYMKPRLKAYT